MKSCSEHSYTIYNSTNPEHENIYEKYFVLYQNFSIIKKWFSSCSFNLILLSLNICLYILDHFSLGVIRHKCFSSRPAEFGFGLEPCGYRSQSDLRPWTTLACRWQLGYGAHSTQIAYIEAVLVNRKLFKKIHMPFSIHIHISTWPVCWVPPHLIHKPTG